MLEQTLNSPEGLSIFKIEKSEGFFEISCNRNKPIKMKNLSLPGIVILFILCLASCEDAKPTHLELPFGGKIASFESNGFSRSDLTSSLWFFENGCVFLVDDCDSFAIGSVEVTGDQIVFSPSTAWLSGDHCELSGELVALLESLSGTYTLYPNRLMTISTSRGNIAIEGSNAVIEPLCIVEDTSK